MQNIKAEQKTKEIADEFSKILRAGDVIALIGDLGSGKTFFVKAVCSNLNIEDVSSPSFAIVNEYNGNYKVNHFDFYRIKKIEELYDIGFTEYLNDEEAITFIEWADMFSELLPRKYYRIQIELKDNSERIITIEKH